MSHFDHIVVGGSFAGLSAALVLGRGSQSVLVLDGGEPRNRFSSAAHSALGFEGKAPLSILNEALDEVKRYPTVQFRRGMVVRAARVADETVRTFEVSTSDGTVFRCNQLIIAAGVSDQSLPLEGLQPFWGRQTLHCPYCHGYEFKNKKLVVLASVPKSAHQATLLTTDWSDDVTIVPCPSVKSLDAVFSAEEQAALASLGVKLFASPAVSVNVEKLKGGVNDEDNGDALAGLVLADGTVVDADCVFVTPKARHPSFIDDLGVETASGPMGTFIRTNAEMFRQTTVEGVFACGDVGQALPSIPLALAGGFLAGVGAHQLKRFPTMFSPLPRLDGK